MDHQAKIADRNAQRETSPKALALDLREFAHDVYDLAELQGQLLAEDMQECGRRVLAPGLVLLGGIAMGVVCVPIALGALALLLVEALGVSYAMAFLTTAAAGLAASGLMCAFGWSIVRQRASVLKRSQQELVRNLRWIRKVLERSRNTRHTSGDNSWRTVA